MKMFIPLFVLIYVFLLASMQSSAKEPVSITVKKGNHGTVYKPRFDFVNTDKALSIQSQFLAEWFSESLQQEYRFSFPSFDLIFNGNDGFSQNLYQILIDPDITRYNFTLCNICYPDLIRVPKEVAGDYLFYCPISHGDYADLEYTTYDHDGQPSMECCRIAKDDDVLVIVFSNTLSDYRDVVSLIYQCACSDPSNFLMKYEGGVYEYLVRYKKVLLSDVFREGSDIKCSYSHPAPSAVEYVQLLEKFKPMDFKYKFLICFEHYCDVDAKQSSKPNVIPGKLHFALEYHPTDSRSKHESDSFDPEYDGRIRVTPDF